MKKQHTEEKIQAFQDSSKPEEPRRVKDLVKILEKSLGVNHFLNIKFNSKNITLCEELMKKQKQDTSSQGPLNNNPSVNKK
ncbi:hypothetical protein NEMIN01_1394 [Nematocida minor]|uniref:uncharacterized protein n=1 Tax=Nematocida minor TaxID=1912983 RepID=UPI0022203A49|nr:uncharacterized protein NEMIN01_1394 [Nematocida minor]KAI5191186.1 hypothetical protein NEMIN01_1394 [Nematocida minor]